MGFDDIMDAGKGAPILELERSKPGLSWATKGTPCDVPQPMTIISMRQTMAEENPRANHSYLWLLIYDEITPQNPVTIPIRFLS